MRNFLTIFLALIATTALWASNFITYTATEKLSETIDMYGEDSGLHTDAFNVAITSHEFSNGIGTITFADDVTTIGHYAFANCYEMISITIPNSVTTIGNEAFVGCSKLTSIYVDASNTHYCSVDGVLFNYPKDTLIQYPIGNTRTEYTIPNSVTTIEWGTFRYCDNLTSVTIPNSVTTIGRLAFNNCDNLTSVAIGNSVTTIGLGAFEFCHGLTSITIPNSVTTIGEVAFLYCESMTSVTIGNSVTTIGEGAFEFCKGLTSITCEAVTPPSCGFGCFSGVNKSIPVYVPALSVSAYQSADGWKDFTNIQAIGTVQNNVIIYTATAKLTNSTLEVGKTTFGSPIISHTFADGTGTITCEGDVTTIGYSAFSFCKGLTSVTIPNSVTVIEFDAFYECSGLTSVAFGNSVIEIGEMAFSYCESLTSIVIPNSVTKIGDYAFQGCTSLTSVTISNSVTTIGEKAFLKCLGLISFDVDAANTHYSSVDGVLFNYAKDTLIQYPAGNTRTEYTIPNSVTTIGEYAFRECPYLTSIIIPNSVTTIGEGGVFYCESLTSITCEAVTPPSCGDACFFGANNYIPVYVPEHSVSAYQSAEGWKYFYNIQAIGTVQNNVIIYMATAKLPETTDEWSGGLHTNAFNVAITSHEFSNGIGTITFAGEVTTIGKCAFLNCYDLISITIPNSVTTIGNAAFSWNSELTLITIPKSVTTIGEGAFAHCSGLTSIYVEAGNTHYCSVDGVLFNYAKDTLIQYPASNSRIEYIIPNSVTTIENNVFYRCSGLISVFIPNSVTTIGETAFQECGSLASINVDAANTHYCSIDGVLFNYTEDTLIQYPVGNTRTEYTIPNLVTTIEYGAFAYCNSLTSVTIPNSVTMIEYQAFYGSGVINVEVAWTSEEQLPSMGWGAFESIANWAGPSAATLHVPTGTKSIYQAADQWKDFGTITDKQPDPKNCVITYTATEKLPETTDNNIWSGSGLHINAFNVAITSHEFSNGIGTITFAGEVTTIGQSAFQLCFGLTSINIPASVITIGSYAFNGCNGLTSIVIPNSVTTIETQAFLCDGLTSIDVDAANTHYCSVDGVLFNYTKDTLIQYPVGNTRTEYTIPNSATTIEYGAFAYCNSLTSVTIPNSVTTIEYLAFYGCSRLTSITCYAVNPPTCGDAAFDGISQDAKVYVPASALADYQSAYYWKDMQLYPIAANVTPMDDENPIVTPTEQDVTITWAITDGADAYTLTITKNGEIVCVLTFNAQGQLVNIAFKAPAADSARQAPAATLTAQGYQFTVTGLTPCTSYEYSVVATGAGGKTIAEHKGNFSTTGGGTPTSIDKVHGSQCTMHKVFRNGQLLIETHNATYTPMGQKVR